MKLINVKKSSVDNGDNIVFQAYDLRTNGISGKVWIGEKEPRLSWKMNHIQGAHQQSYRILAASTVEKLNKPDLWDSTWVNSSDSIGIVWKGTPLKSRQRVFWQVFIKDDKGNISKVSQVAEFETALLKNKDWNARSIYFDGNNPTTSSPCPYFRYSFSINKPIKRAVLYVTAKGLFEPRINGQRVGNDHFVPGWTDFDKQIQYLAYDVTEQLNLGENVAGAILGDGWYSGYLVRRKRNYYGEYPELLFQLEITYSDETVEQILSGKNWKTTTGPILASDIYDGEQYDARLEMPNWDKPNFDDSKWKNAKLGKGKTSPQLVCKCCPPVRQIMEIKPVAILNPQQDIYIWDFGQNLTGRMRVRLKGHPGRLYSFHFSEMLNPDGTLYNLNYRSAKSTDFYACKGPIEEYEEWEPAFTFHGFRYLQINGFQYSDATVDDIEVSAIVMHSDIEIIGSFESGNKKVNQLFSNITWGQRDNFLEIPTDCPQRDERLGWTGDADVFIGAASYIMNIGAFFRKWLRDLREAQREDGAVPNIVPDLLKTYGVAVWADAAVRCPWTVYIHNGDKTLLQESFDSMKKWVDYQEKTSNKHIRPATSFGDWLALSAVETPSELIGTALFAETARITGITAGILRRNKDKAYYTTLSQKVKDAFQREFLDNNGVIKVNSQTACVLALHFNLLPQDKIVSNAELLKKLIEENGNKLSTGFVGTAWITQALSEVGLQKVACDLLLQEEYPSWLFSVNQGATTVWERWNSYTKKDGFGNVNMNSFNHYAYGAVAEWMMQSLGGIQFDEKNPGGKLLLFAVKPDQRLKYVKCCLDTPYGLAKSNWKFTKDNFIWKISAPCNTNIKVLIPDIPSEEIKLNGKNIEEKIIELSNGEWEISVRLLK